MTYREEDRACENKEANRQRRRDRSDSNHSNETASNEQLVLGQLNRINETETPVLTEVEVPKVRALIRMVLIKGTYYCYWFG